MEQDYIQGKRFDKVDFSKIPLPKSEYEKCTFSSCDFSNSDLSGIVFSACVFEGCNLSMVKLVATALRDIRFKDCKMLGLHFEDSNKFLFSVCFDNCTLNLSSFYQQKLRKTVFKNSQLHEVDFTESDLGGAVFDNCDLKGAIFGNTILERADFSTAINYSIDPEQNRVKKAKFALSGIPGLLDKYDIDIEM